VLKKTLIKLNALKEGQFFHIGYGLVRKKDERFSGRKGTWIGFTADELLEEGIKRIKEGDKDKIALAAIKFSMLKISSKKELIFDWDKALSIQGDSGPYVLYSLVRAKNILKNSSSSNDENLKLENKNLDLNKEEKMLMRLIWAYPFYVKKAFMSFEPNVICDYLLDLCQSFNTFYEKHRVIGSDKEEIRLNIIRHFVKTCEKALYLLGIQPVNYM
jgi:arginyl-tRNA synthetase